MLKADESDNDLIRAGATLAKCVVWEPIASVKQF